MDASHCCSEWSRQDRLSTALFCSQHCQLHLVYVYSLCLSITCKVLESWRTMWSPCNVKVITCKCACCLPTVTDLSHHLPQRLHINPAAYERESPVLKEHADVATVASKNPLCWILSSLFHPGVFGDGIELNGYHQTPKPPEHNISK